MQYLWNMQMSGYELFHNVNLTSFDPIRSTPDNILCIVLIRTVSIHTNFRTNMHALHDHPAPPRPNVQPKSPHDQGYVSLETREP
jgi:hypothetical protein